MVFSFRASLTRGIVFKIPGTVTRLPGVNGDVTYVKRRTIAAGILACHENAEKVITPLQVVESFRYFLVVKVDLPSTSQTVPVSYTHLTLPTICSV